MKTKSKLRWSRDGDQWVAEGERGQYRITCWSLRSGDEYALTITFHNHNPVLDGRGAIGGWDTLTEAKQGATNFDNMGE